MKNTVKKTKLLLLLAFVCKLHSQNAETQVNYFTPTDVINLSLCSKYKKTDIKEEFKILMQAAQNNFPNNNSIDSSLIYRREASLLHSICFYKMLEYKSEVLILHQKHKELYLIEEKRRQDYLKANSGEIGLKVRFGSNYHKIYKFIEDYIIPCLENGTTKDFLYKNFNGDMFFFTSKELSNRLDKS